MTADILVLCTANIARSPMAEAMLAQRLQAHGVDATVSSAGFRTQDRPAAAETVKICRKLGIDVSAHRSRTIDEAMAERADLILTMEQAHVREVTVLHPPALGRSFTLPEFVRRGRVAPRMPDEPIRAWAERVGADRAASDLVGLHAGDEIADPYGRGRRAFRRIADHVAALLDELVPQLQR